MEKSPEFPQQDPFAVSFSDPDHLHHSRTVAEPEPDSQADEDIVEDEGEAAPEVDQDVQISRVESPDFYYDEAGLRAANRRHEDRRQGISDWEGEERRREERRQSQRIPSWALPPVPPTGFRRHREEVRQPREGHAPEHEHESLFIPPQILDDGDEIQLHPR